MLENYFSNLMFVLVGVTIGVLPLAMAGGWSQPSGSAKTVAYECGLRPSEDARMKFDVRYYLMAIIFILFDLEIAFLFPWAMIFKRIVETPGSDVRFRRDDGLRGHSRRWLRLCLGQGRLEWGIKGRAYRRRPSGRFCHHHG